MKKIEKVESKLPVGGRAEDIISNNLDTIRNRVDALNRVFSRDTDEDFKKSNEWCVRNPEAIVPRYLVHMSLS